MEITPPMKPKSKNGRFAVSFSLSTIDSYIIFIFVLGIISRLFLLYSGIWINYQSDLSTHIELIDFLIQNKRWPYMSELWQAPQQPLYYWIGTCFWNPSIPSTNKDMIPLAGFSGLISCLGLTLSYIASLTFRSRAMRLAFIGFLSLTPAFVLSSTKINNDTLVLFFGQTLFFSICLFNKTVRLRWLIACYATIILALLTKINAISLLCAFPIIFGYGLYKFKTDRIPLLIVTGIFILILWIWSVWTHHKSTANSDSKILSYSKFDNQTINDVSARYWVEFNIFKLIECKNAGTSPSTPDSVRFSFLTKHYGTMLTGEFKLSKNSFSGWVVRVIYLTGLVIPMAAIIGCFNTAKNITNLTRKPIKSEYIELLISSLVTLASICLVVILILNAPNACSNDFRYNAPAINFIAFLFAFGFVVIRRYRILKNTSLYLLNAYLSSSLILTTLILIGKN